MKTEKGQPARQEERGGNPRRVISHGPQCWEETCSRGPRTGHSVGQARPLAILSRMEGRGPGLMGVGSRENGKRGAFWTGSRGNSSKELAKKRSRKMEEELESGDEVRRG